MSLITEHIRAHLSGGAEPQNDLSDAERRLSKTIEEDGLSIVITSALTLRRQGRIDQSIPLITQANRVQLDAIEGIQASVDTLLNKDPRPIVFAKYRQYLPFEMGIENGDDVVDLVARIDANLASETTGVVERLHSLEKSRCLEAERLTFFETRFENGGEDETIKEAREALHSISNALEKTKVKILDAVMSVVVQFISSIDVRGDMRRVKYDLSKWLYVLITSPTKTCCAKHVQVAR